MAQDRGGGGGGIATSEENKRMKLKQEKERHITKTRKDDEKKIYSRASVTIVVSITHFGSPVEQHHTTITEHTMQEVLK